MSKKVKIGIIGIGTIGSVHADAYAKIPEAEVVALCDILPDRLKEKAARHGIAKTYATHQELLADPEIEAVSVCVPNYMHAPIAIDALNAGKHVMLEKPMSIKAEYAQQICDARDKNGKLLQMGMVRRQAADAQLVHRHIQEGRFGDIYHIGVKLIRRRGIPGMGGWFTTKAMSGGGGLIDIAVHSLDLAMWATNLWKPVKVSAKTYSKFGSPMRDYHFVDMWAGPPNYDGTFDVDDYATGFVRFDNQASLCFEVAWACNAKPESYVEILGTKGGIKLEGGNATFLTEYDNMLADINLAYNANVDGFVAELSKFVKAINGEGEIPATGDQGVIVMKLLDAIYKSCELNREVDI